MTVAAGVGQPSLAHGLQQLCLTCACKSVYAYGQVADSMPWAAGDLVMGSSAAIWSFKEIKLGIGELDFQADDGFLEAILSFVISLPTADIWQVRPQDSGSGVKGLGYRVWGTQLRFTVTRGPGRMHCHGGSWEASQAPRLAHAVTGSSWCVSGVKHTGPGCTGSASSGCGRACAAHCNLFRRSSCACESCPIAGNLVNKLTSPMQGLHGVGRSRGLALGLATVPSAAVAHH